MVYVASLDASTIPYLVGLLVLVFAAHWYVTSQAEKKKKAIWAQVAKHHNLTVVDGFDLRGRVDGNDVTAEIYTTGSGKNRKTYTRVVIDGGLTQAVSLSREGLMSGLLGEDIFIGDPLFDNSVKIHGDEVIAVALLDAEMRVKVRHAIIGQWRFTQGRWIHELPGGAGKHVGIVIEQGLDLARAVRAAQADPIGRLGNTARFDRVSAVRKRALEILVTYHPDHPATHDAASKALYDPNLDLVSIAARHLRDLAVLDRLANERDASQALRIDAMRTMVRVAPDDARGAMIVAKWLTFHSPADRGFRLAAIAALPSVEVLDAETRLIEALGSDDDDVVLQAIKTLGVLGTVTSVPALIPLRDKLLGFTHKGAAKDAILAIQARITGANAGALALSNEGGTLAFVDEPST